MNNSRKLLAECFGTFALVFAGTGAIVINDETCGAISHVGIALTFGLVVLAMIYSIGDVSGCHLNPAVTVAFVLSGSFSRNMVVPYVISQLIGAVLASLSLHAIFPSHLTLGATMPTGSHWQSFVLEFILSFILMFVILSVSSDSKGGCVMAGAAIGAVVALEAIFAGPISGASMNPARSFGPAIVSAHLESLWIYVTAPIIGAATSVFFCSAILGPRCGCRDSE